MKLKNIVIIPVYKSTINENAMISFRQCCKILGKHPICLFTYASLDCSLYEKIAKRYDVTLLRENFDASFFDDIAGYNKLMLNVDFYERFEKYKYMLIYQLDAYVFRDELDYWCDEGYDYIGAPWFENFGTHEDGNELWEVGNGGFSLRKISKIISFLRQNRVYSWDYFKAYYSWDYFKANYYKGNIKTFVVCVLHCFGYKANYYKGKIKKFVVRVLRYFGYKAKLLSDTKLPNEDYVYSILSRNTRCKISKPTKEKSVFFSFEKSPKYLFSVIRGLPFGCHAWHKYGYDEFWKGIIV